jgi:hypothetical protein
MIGISTSSFFVPVFRPAYGIALDFSGDSALPYQYSSDPDFTLEKQNSIVEGYNRLVEEKMKEGWNASLVTFMFGPLFGSHTSIVERMKKSIVELYSRFLTRVVRRPNAKCNKPILICMADRPVPKFRKTSIRAAVVNGGIHCHGILLIPPKSRLKTTVREHFLENERIYLMNSIDHIDVEPIVTQSAEKVTDYVFKSWRRGLSYNQHVLILPKVFSELSTKTR